MKKKSAAPEVTEQGTGSISNTKPKADMKRDIKIVSRSRRNKVKKPRQPAVELLRILSMLMVVLLHMFSHGGILEHIVSGTVNYYLVWILEGLSFVSINCYVLISGYFLCDSRVSSYKIVKMETQVLFYSVGIYLLLLVTGRIEVEAGSLVSAIFPVFSCEYWFITMYMGMYLLSPFLNKLINTLTRRQFRMLLILLFLLFSAWPNVFFFSAGLNFGGGSGVVWFIVVYLFGAWLKRYYVPDGKTAKHFGIYLAVALVVPLSRFLIEVILASPLGKISLLNDLMWGFSLFFQYNSIPVFLASYLLFKAFLNVKIRSAFAGKLITAVSPLALGVYLIHDNPNFRLTLWSTLEPVQYIGYWYLVPALIGLALAIFIIFALVEKIRSVMFALLSWKGMRLFFLKVDQILFRRQGL